MDLFKLIGSIVIDSDDANEKLDKIKDKVDVAKEKISTGFGNISNVAVTAGKTVVGALVGSGAIGGALVSLTDNTMEYRTAMGKLETAFTTSGHTVEAATSTYSDLVSVLGDSDVAVEAANHLAKLTTNEQELQTWTNICTGVYATFGDSLPIEGLTEAANETAKVGEVTGPLADALNWAGVSEDEFNEKLAACTTEQERQQAIMDTLNGIYDEASQKYQTINADVIAANEAQDKYTSAMSDFGEKAQPIVNAVKDGLGDLLTAGGNLISGLDFSKVSSAIESGFSFLIDSVVPKVEEFFNFITEHGDAIITIIAAIAAGFVAWNVVTIVQGVIAVIKAWQIATKGMTVAQTLFNLVLKDNPAGVVITVIAALVAAIIALWNTNDDFRNAIISAWEAIKNAFSTVIEAIKGFFTGLVDGISAAWEAIKEAVSTAFETIKNVIEVALAFIVELITAWFDLVTLPWRFIWENCKEYIFEAWEAIKNAISTALDAISETISTVWNAIVNFITPILESIKNVVTTVWEGIKSVVTTVVDAIKDKVSSVFNAVKTVVSDILEGIKSTFTTVWDGVKTKVTDVVDGVKDKISTGLDAAKTIVSDVLGSIKDKFSDIFEGAKNIVSNAIDKIKGFFDFDWSLPSLKLPHFSITGSFSLNPPSVPKFAIDWYAKAMEDPMLMETPTPFGVNKNGQIMAGGEAGSEVVSGTAKLMEMISQAVASQNAALIAVLELILAAIRKNNSELADCLREAMEGMSFKIHNREFARLVKAVT